MKTVVKFLVLAMLALSAQAGFAVNVDGKISSGEYAREANFDSGNYILRWSIQGDTLFMAIEAATPGWVAVGFDPSSVMANCDMVFGIIDSHGTTQAIDAWSRGMFGPHPADKDQGGASNLLAAAGSRAGNSVIFEFSRKLSTGDRFDKVIPASGSLKVIWAYSRSTQFDAKHSRAGSAMLQMGGTP